MLELGTCMATGYDENGFIGVQIDGFGGPDSSTQFEQLSHAFGFAARALDPEKGVGCTLFRWSQRRRRHMWLGDDPRLVDKIPRIKKGGSVQYASDGSFASFDPETHTWTLYVPYADGKAHLHTVGKDGNGTPIVEFASGEGPAFTILGQVTTLKNAGGSAYVVIDDSGTSIVGPFKAAGGADLGGPTSVPLVKFPALSPELAAVQNAITLLSAAVTAIAAVPVNSSAAAAPAGAAAAATIAALAALATFSGAGPTITTKGA